MSGPTLTSIHLTDKKIDVPLIVSSFETLKAQFPDVFTTVQDIENFIAGNNSYGIGDCKTCFYKFDAVLNIFVINNDNNHAIKDTLDLMQKEMGPLCKLFSCIEAEYDCYKKHQINNIEKMCKIMKYAPDTKIAQKAIEDDDTYRQNSMIYSQNDTRIIILNKMISIEHLIEKLKNPQSTNKCFF